MTIQQQAQIELATRELEKRYEKQRNSLYEFLLFYWREEKKLELDENRHIKEICSKLEDVFYGKIKRLIINIPPRALKTEIVSRAFPARCLGKREEIKFMWISYSASLSQDNSGDCRAIYTSDTFKKVFPRVQPLKDDQNTKTHRENIKGGQYYASGSTGTITGKWCDCLTWDTIISTNKWYMRLDELVKSNDCNITVNSYNGTTEEQKTVLAYRIIPNATIYEITLSTWDKLRTTWNHRIFILWQWYKETQNLKEWDIVMRERQEMHKLLNWEVMKMTTMQRMLSKQEKSYFWHKVLSLLSNMQKATKRYKESIEKMTKRYVLWQEMFMNSIYGKVLKQMCHVWQSKSKQNKEVLFEWLQNIASKTNKDIKWNKMLNVRKDYKTIIINNKILFYGMQKLSSLKKYVMNMKFKLQTLISFRWVPKWILQNEKISIKKRWLWMCNLLNKRKTCNSSQRQESKEQRNWKSCDCMCYSSCDTSLKQNITISSVKRLENNETVYDIQVEWNENFFANGILVHNCLLIDDPVKPNDANSDIVRIWVNNNFHNTLYSRLNNKVEGAIVIIMQRLHDDDLCWHLIEQEKMWEKRDKLVIKAIAEEDDEYRKKWESFFEKRFPLHILQEIKQKDPQSFSSQYQQEPTNRETQEFHEERFKYHGENTPNKTPPNLRIFTAVDPAFKQGQENDQTSIMTIWFLWDEAYILEYTAGRFTATETQDKIIYHIQKRRPEKVGIEAFQAQSMINTFLKNELTNRGIFANIEEIRQSGDKLSKIRKLIPLYRAGKIYHKTGMDELELEEKRFPRGKHDDIVDSLQMCYDLYQLQPNATRFRNEIQMSRDQFGNPIIR